MISLTRIQKDTHARISTCVYIECSNDDFPVHLCVREKVPSLHMGSYTKTECGSDAVKDILSPASFCLLIDSRVTEAIFIRNTRLHERHSRVAFLSLSELDCHGRIDVVRPIREAPVLHDLLPRYDLPVRPDDASTKERERTANLPADAGVALCECL